MAAARGASGCPPLAAPRPGLAERRARLRPWSRPPRSRAPSSPTGQRSCASTPSPSGRVVVSNPAPSPDSTTEIWRLEEDLRIGAVTATDDDPYLFGNVMSFAATPDGTLLVADNLAGEIRVFDPDGGFLRRFGGKGEGPGEFALLAGVVWDQASEIAWVADATHRRFMAFTIDGELLGEHRYSSSNIRATTIPWAGYADHAGNLYDQDLGTPEHLVRRVTSATGAMTIVDSLALPTLEAPTYPVDQGFMVEVRTVPMSPIVLWTVAPDGWVWLGRSDEFRLHKVAFSGDTVRTVELDRPAPRLAGRERDSIAAAAGLPQGMLPRVKPVMGRHVGVAPDGWIWVAVPASEVVQVWDLFDESGHYRGRAVSPFPIADIPPPVLGVGTVTGVIEDELGVQRIVRLRRTGSVERRASSMPTG